MEAAVYSIVRDGDFIGGDGKEAYQVVFGLVGDGDYVIGAADGGGNGPGEESGQLRLGAFGDNQEGEVVDGDYIRACTMGWGYEIGGVQDVATTREAVYADREAQALPESEHLADGKWEWYGMEVGMGGEEGISLLGLRGRAWEAACCVEEGVAVVRVEVGEGSDEGASVAGDACARVYAGSVVEGDVHGEYLSSPADEIEDQATQDQTPIVD